MKKIEFIISIGVGFGEVFSGGVLVLHRLAYEIASRGYKVTIFTKPEYPHKNIFVESNSDENNLNFKYDPKNTIIIPSHNWKNNSDIKNVARWILYHIDKNEMDNIDDTDIIFNYGSFKTGNYNNHKKLTVFDYHEDIFKNQQKDRYKKFCYITNKNHPDNWYDVFENQYGAENLTNWKTKGYQYLADRFNEYEYLLTYDDKSFYTLAAVMCGTKVILLGCDGVDNLNYKLKTPYNLFGVACGFEDIEWAEKTIHMAPLLVNELKKSDKLTVDDFIKYWEEKIIKEMKKNKKIALISTFCDTEEKQKILKENIIKIKNIGIDVIAISPIPIPQNIVDLCDYFFYTKENPLLEWPIRMYTHWYELKLPNGQITTLQRGLADYGWAGLYQVKKLSEIALSFDYDIFYHMIYDLLIDDVVEKELLNDETNIIHPRRDPHNPETLWETTLHFMVFDRPMMEKIVKEITLDEYLSTNGVAEGEVLKWKNKFEIPTSNHPVKDQIFYWEDYDFFDYSPYPYFKFFISKNEKMNVWLGENSPYESELSDNLKLVFHGFEIMDEIEIIVNEKSFLKTPNPWEIIEIPISSQNIQTIQFRYQNELVDFTSEYKKIMFNQIYYNHRP